MFKTRRKRLAWLFALVLLAELALLCCACVLFTTHQCPGHDRCGVCAALNPARRFALAALILALGLPLAASPAASAAWQAVALLFTPISLRVRLND